MEKFVLYFDEIDKTSLPYAGGKGANLGEMTKAGFPVPQGFCITTSAFQAFVGTSSEMNNFFEKLDRINADNLDEICALGEEIRSHLESMPLLDDIQSSILGAWKRTGQNKAYAVRSSATAEDLPTASFAGQQETYLNVLGEEQLLDSVRRCFASLFTDRAISYRAKNGFDHRQVFLSVVVQEMILPEVSGIMFTADPISGNRKVISIDASFGLGEALVSGLVSADLYQVRDNKIIGKKVSSKKIAIYPIPEGGTVTKPLSTQQQEAQALPDERIIELAKLGLKIEKHYGLEQDIEWCFADGKFYIVQSRPITSLYPVPKALDDCLHVFFSLGHQQMMTDAISPLGISVLRTLPPFGKAGSAQSESPYVQEAGSHLFFDPTELLYLKPARHMLPKMFRAIDERIGSAVEEVVSRPEFQHTADKQLKKAFRRTALAAIKAAIPGLFIKDYKAAREDARLYLEGKVHQTESFINEVSGPERIRRIQESLSNVILTIVKKMAPYMFSALASRMLTEVLIKRWLGNDERIPLLNKSLPGNVTSELGLMIGDLADMARQHPQVVEYLQSASDETFLEGLLKVQGGDEFRKAFEGFLSIYGMRCPGEIDIANARWWERPTALVPPILSHIRSVEIGEHRKKFAEGEAEAEEAAKGIILDVRRTFGGFLKAKILARLIRNYRNFMGIREYPKYIVIRHFDVFKRAILDEAEALVAKGKLAHESDVLYLSLSELTAMEEDAFSGDVYGLIENRKGEHQRNKKLMPPRVITSEGEIVTGRRRDVSAPEGSLIGTPVSAGIVEGYARVVLSPSKARLNQGEIMIAPFTDPGWTPLFQSAKGLVMEVGGMMTHGAVVAREYGIPAVVGIDGATGIIKDGDYIRVNGTEGYVELLKK